MVDLDFGFNTTYLIGKVNINQKGFLIIVYRIDVSWNPI